MAWHLVSTKPLFETMLEYCQVIQENAFENIICQMVAI